MGKPGSRAVHLVPLFFFGFLWRILPQLRHLAAEFETRHRLRAVRDELRRTHHIEDGM